MHNFSLTPPPFENEHCQVLKSLIPTEHDMWNEKTKEIGVHTDKSWISKNSTSVPSMVTKGNKKLHR